MEALFVTLRNDWKEGGAGVQLCSREYFDTLSAAGFDLTPVRVDYDQRLVTRARRKLSLNPYRHTLDFDAIRGAVAGAIRPQTRFVFVNHASLRPIGEHIRPVLPASCRTVLLSHGLKSVDYLHEIRSRALIDNAKIGKFDRYRLAEELLEEAGHSAYWDHVFCLSEFEMGVEKWLGIQHTAFLPRLVQADPLAWNPVEGQMGYVGTLDHPPNREGLVLFLDEMAKLRSPELKFRLVGSPANKGKWFSERYDFVEYLGRLDDDALAAEASTWTCMVHPVFSFAMGASTKLAVAIGWEIPVVTTTMGRRGYVWTEGSMRIGDTPEAMAVVAMNTSHLDAARRAQDEMRRIRETMPQIDDVVRLIREALSV
jgi:hypothetical protein